MPNDINEMKKFVNNVKKLVEKKVNNAKTDTSKKAIVQSLNEDGTANIIINGEVYNNVKVRPGLQPQINEVVLVSIPNNNTKDMFIDLASSTSTSGGGTNHTHSNLSILETITQALIDAWNSAVSHISDTIRHITSNERDLWNTVSNKIDNTEVVTTATPNKILKLDSNGKLPASITGNADGNAATATKLQTARTISLSGDVTGSANFDGSADISINTTRLIKNNSFILDSLYTFTRSSTAYLSDGTLVNINLPRFEQGKFGKAILIEEGTTNLLTNPFFSSGLSGWSTQNVTGDNEVYVTDGVVVIKAVDAIPGLYQKVNLDVGTIVTVSILIKRTSGSIAPRLRWGQGSVIGEIEISENGQWVKYSAITDVQGNGNLIIEPSIAGQVEYEIKAVQLEQKPYATSFINGTRAAETLTIPTAGVLNPQEGTVEFWVYPFNTVKTLNHDRLLFSSANSLPGVFWCNINPNQQLRFVYDSNGVSVALTGGTVPNLSWSRITIRWNTSGVACFINGVLVASDARPITAISGAVLYIGSYNTQYHANVLIDDLRISDRARTDEEILAAYQSNEPLPYDAYTTWLSRFDNNYGLIGNSSNQIPVSNGILCTNLNADTVDGKHVDDSKTDTNSLWTASKIVNYVDPALDGKTKRINLTGQCQASSYKRSVIALVEVTNTNPNLNSNTQGIITFHRSNGLMGNVMALVNMEKRYNTTRVNYHGLTMGLNANNIRPCTFTYNGIKYGGIEFFFADAELSNIEFNGMTNFNIFGIDYYDTRGTILNSEIYNSLNFSDVNWINDIYMNNTAISKEGHTHDRINGIKISVGSIAPPSPQLNDIWIDTSS